MINKFIESHLEVFLYAVFHFISMLFYSYLEYLKGKDPSPENSYMAILLKKLQGDKK